MPVSPPYIFMLWFLLSTVMTSFTCIS